nr:MAG TPA: hypothetical protein [Caudoviricetes sp.]
MAVTVYTPNPITRVERNPRVCNSAWIYCGSIVCPSAPTVLNNRYLFTSHLR